MNKTFCYVGITHYGDEWEHYSHEIFKNLEDAKKFEEEHIEEMKDVNGVDCVRIDIDEVSEKELRRMLTVNEYCELFPEIKELINEYFSKE